MENTPKLLVIDKIELNDYSNFSTLYIKADKQTIADILAYVAALNNENYATEQPS